VLVRLHPALDRREVAVGVDHEGRALDPHVRLAVVLLLDPHAVVLGHRVLGVGQQRERQPVFGLNVRCDSGDCGLTPITFAPIRPNSAQLSRMLQAWRVQPGVSSLG
jgi:hypothetical protein